MKKPYRSNLSLVQFSRLLKRPRPLRIGLTGGIGAGKSVALAFFESKKIPVLQTDHLGHQLLEDKKVIAQLVKAFGKGILSEKRRIDRKKLAQAAFQSPRHQKKLNGIMHPAVRKAVGDWTLRQAKRKLRPAFVVVEVPLLFERGFNRSFDAVLSISASDAIRQKRLKKRGWSLAEIRQRTKLQWPQKRKDGQADWVIYNQMGEKDLKYALYQWMAPFLNL